MISYTPPDEGLICQRSAPMTIAGLFGGITIFTVPPFQRDYAWDETAIEIFIGDVDRCRERRLNSSPQSHFFGAIVTSPDTGKGTPRPHAILIDGQQRLATVFLFVCKLRKRFHDAAENADTEELQRAFRARCDDLMVNFEWVSDLEFREPKERRKLNLNRVDDPFFKLLLDGAEGEPQRRSHKNLKLAADKIEAYFDGLFARRVDSEDDERILNTLYTNFLRDWEIVHISADKRRHANTIYRVLNSRGVPVTDCDLLRAATLERVEGPLGDEDVQNLSDAWDEILGIEVVKPDICLDLAFQSRNGQKRPKDRTATSFETTYFPALDTDDRLTAPEANDTVQRALRLRDDCVKVGRMLSGTPPLPDGNDLTPVARERFRAITSLFRQDYCIPLLLAASCLPTGEFTAVVTVLDRFAFRYGVIVRAPIGPFDRAVEDHIRTIREDSSAFELGRLTENLQALLNRYAPLDVFRQSVERLRHGIGHGAKVRYLLSMIEWMDAWYANGGQGIPRVYDESRSIDLDTITLDHIGAKRGEDASPDLQPLINTIGNLTLLSAGENNEAADKSFEGKLPIYARSNFAINRALAALGTTSWGAQEVTNREADFLQRCERIFSLIPT